MNLQPARVRASRGQLTGGWSRCGRVDAGCVLGEIQFTRSVSGGLEIWRGRLLFHDDFWWNAISRTAAGVSMLVTGHTKDASYPNIQKDGVEMVIDW